MMYVLILLAVVFAILLREARDHHSLAATISCAVAEVACWGGAIALYLHK